MAEENQVTTNIEEKEVTAKGSKEVTTKGPKKVITKDPKKVEEGNRLAEWNLKNKKVKKSQYYGIGVVLAVGVIGSLGYYLYQAKVNVAPPQQPRPQTNKFEIFY